MIETPYNFEALPKKRMSAGALFLNDAGNILIVKPTYRSDWLLPGGIIEEQESPRKACIREVKEELNLDIPLSHLLCIEYLTQDLPHTECVQFVFAGGHLDEAQIRAITLPPAELADYRFSPLDEACFLLSTKLARRLPHCLDAFNTGITVYLEDGRPPS